MKFVLLLVIIYLKIILNNTIQITFIMSKSIFIQKFLNINHIITNLILTKIKFVKSSSLKFNFANVNPNALLVLLYDIGI